MSSEATWYYECNGERKGPVATETIVDLHSKGELGADTLVWREGMPDWAALNATELASAVGAVRRPPALGAAAPPPVPNAVVPFVPRTARLRDDFRPAIRSSYGRAWALLKTRFWPLVGCFTLSMLIMSVASQFYLPAFFLMFPIVGGLYWYILKCIRGEVVTMESLFEGFRRQFGALAVLNLIVVGIIMVFMLIVGGVIAALVFGLGEGVEAFFSSMEDNPAAVAGFVGAMVAVYVVLAIPLMLVGMAGAFGTMLILDSELKAGEAFSLGWQATKRSIGKLILFMLVNAFLSFLGMLALYVGMFITGTWATIAMVYLYEDAFGDKPQRIS